MQALFAVVVVLGGTIGVSIFVWAATKKPPLFQIRNACLFGGFVIVLMIVLLLAATWVRDEVFTTTMLLLVCFIMFRVGRVLNQI